MTNYIIAVEDADNKVRFQGRAAQLVEKAEDALPFTFVPKYFTQNMRANGLQPIIIGNFGKPEQFIVAAP